MVDTIILWGIFVFSAAQLFFVVNFAFRLGERLDDLERLLRDILIKIHEGLLENDYCNKGERKYGDNG